MSMKDPVIDIYDEEGSGGDWLVTFADLMALLLAFFVLLYSFSDVDAAKYKTVVTAFSDTFSSDGARRDSIINIDPTPPEVIEPPLVDTPAVLAVSSGSANTNKPIYDLANQLSALVLSAEELGWVETDVSDDNVIIRLSGDNTFLSGSAEIQPDYEPILEKLALFLIKTPMRVSISGHTDNQPYAGSRYTSNWELSAARAVVVAEYFLSYTALEASNFEVRGYADTLPRATNSTDMGRSENRRVELTLSFLENDG